MCCKGNFMKKIGSSVKMVPVSISDLEYQGKTHQESPQIQPLGTSPWSCFVLVFNYILAYRAMFLFGNYQAFHHAFRAKKSIHYFTYHVSRQCRQAKPAKTLVLIVTAIICRRLTPTMRQCRKHFSYLEC